MADITKCWGKGCKLKDKCYRYIVEGNKYWQSYFIEEPYKNEKDEEYCRHFWETKKMELFENFCKDADKKQYNILKTQFCCMDCFNYFECNKHYNCNAKKPCKNCEKCPGCNLNKNK